LIALDKGETADSLKGLDMVLLLGTPSEPVAQAADLVAELLSLEEECQEVEEPWDKDVGKFQGWNEHGDIEEINCPAVETFWQNHMWKERPVKITKSIEHFPATQKWSLKYLLKVFLILILRLQQTILISSGCWEQNCTSRARTRLYSSPLDPTADAVEDFCYAAPNRQITSHWLSSSAFSIHSGSFFINQPFCSFSNS